MLTISKFVWSIRINRCLSTIQNTGIINCPNQLIKKWTVKFNQSRVPEPQLSAEFIVQHVLNERNNEVLFHSRTLTNIELARIEQLCQKRLQRVPVQYIIGEWDFRTVNLKLRPPVLIPRPETEDLVGHILDHLEKEKRNNLEEKRFLEMGCGSGAISISLLKEFQKMNGVAFDILPEAVELTNENSILNGVQSRLSTSTMSIEDCPLQIELQFDHLISNPPYIRTKDIDNLQPEVSRYESHLALDGGKDGLELIYHILEIAKCLLKPNGYLWLESGLDHDLKSLVLLNPQWSLQYISHLPDFTGRLRFHKIIRQN